MKTTGHLRLLGESRARRRRRRAIGAAVAAPLLRSGRACPPPATVAACAGGPLGLAVLRPRSHKRDVAMYALQMWAFTMVHELPFDDPERLRARLQIRYPIVARPGARPRPAAQRAPAARPRPPAPGSTALNRFLTWVHWLWFLEPYVALAYILLRHPERFPRAARRLAAVFDIGCGVYFAAPTAPPWWAFEKGHTGRGGAADHGRGRRGDLEVGLAGDVRGARRQPLGGDALAALRDLGRRRRSGSPKPAAAAGAAGWAYALTLGFALVYLGEHYVTDLSPAPAWWPAVRRGEPLAEPAVSAVNRRLRAWSASPAGSFSGVSPGSEPANGNGGFELPLFTPRRMVQTLLVVIASWSGSTSSSRSWSGWATR